MAYFKKPEKINPNVNNEGLGERAWVIQTYAYKPLVASDIFVEKFEKIRTEWEAVASRPTVKSLSERELDERRDAFFNDRCEAEGIRSRVAVQQIAFYDKRLAESVAQHIIGSLPPVELEVSKIFVRIDEYREQVLDRKIPFFIVLEDGVFSMEDNPYEIFEIKRPSADPNYPKIFSGTFWADTHHEALSDAQHWEERWSRL